MSSSDLYRPEFLMWRDLHAAMGAWIESLRSDRFWIMLLDNGKASERVRDTAMKAVVWLEMKGYSNQAKELDDAVQAMREAVFACMQAMALHGPSRAKDVPEVQALRNIWVEKVENLRTVVERVMADVPPEVWEGIDG